MATEESVREDFLQLGVEISGSVLHKCVNLCNSNGLDSEAFAEQWMAFSLSHLDGADPTLDSLELMERKEFSKKENEHIKNKIRTPNHKASYTIYQGDNPVEHNDQHGVMYDYMSNPPKGHDVDMEKLTVNIKSDTISSICPATYSPTKGQCGKYSTRTNSGDVVCSYGEEESNWTNVTPDVCKIIQLPNHEGNMFSNKAEYGFELLQEKASILDSNIKYLSQFILNNANISNSVSVKYKSQVPVTVVGRIDCDAQGRLNNKSVLLQGTWDDSLGQSVPIDLDRLKQYSLFPGQIVALNGINTRGDRFIAQQVFSDASYQKPPQINIVQGIDIISVCGPYTPLDNLSYNPLTDVIKYITKHKPHAAILMGPFVDCNHQNVKDNTIAENYKTFFEKLVDNLMTAIESSSPHTQVLMVASSKDVFHTNIYPTPAYNVKKVYNNLKMLPDPCTVNIGGVIVGITCTDVLMHLSKEEISFPAHEPDRIGRLAGHLLNQQSFYPLWPPSASLSVDTLLLNDYGHMPTTPNLLLLSSDFRYFVKEINGCVVINSERLVKGLGGGTFARIRVKPNTENKNILCQVLRI